MLRNLIRSALPLVLLIAITPIQAATPIDHTVAVLAYYERDGRSMPARIANGVLLDHVRVVSSRKALLTPPVNPFATGVAAFPTRSASVPASIYIIMQVGGQQVVAAAKLASNASGSDADAVLLTLNSEGQQWASKLLQQPAPIAPLPPSGEVSVVGTLAPSGLTPEQLNQSLVPRPVAMRMQLSGAIGDQSAAVAFPLPVQFSGAGAWDSNGRLLGLVLHEDQRWRVRSITAIRQSLGLPEPTIATVPPDASANESPADPAAMSPDGEAPSTPSETVAGSEFQPGAASPLPPRPSDDQAPPAAIPPGMSDLLDSMGLEPKLDPGLVDHVGQDQADVVMAYIAAGQYEQALAFIDDVLPLASGTLAERLIYRRALALVLSGNYKEAAAAAVEVRPAKDRRVQSRVRVLSDVLKANPDGTFEGRTLSEPGVLVAAIQSELSRVRKRVLSSFEAARSQQLVGRTSYDLTVQKLDQIQQTLDAYDGAWPGFFDALQLELESFRQQLRLDAYTRIPEALRQMRLDYAAEVTQAEYKEAGPLYSRAGYWPPLRVGNANVIAENYAALLEHRAELASGLNPEYRTELPAELQTPLERLPLAKQADRR